MNETLNTGVVVERKKRVFSAETRLKMRLAKLGKKRGPYNKKHAEEVVAEVVPVESI